MWFSGAEASAVGRCLAQIAGETAEIADLFLERRHELELRSEEPGPGIVERRDEGLAFRVVRRGSTYLAARDGFDPKALESALREVARVAPANAYRLPDLVAPGSVDDPDRVELEDFPARVRRAVRGQLAAFDFGLRVGRHSRSIQLVGRRLVPEAQTERFFSVSCSSRQGIFGTLIPELDDETARTVATGLVSRFQARAAAPVRGFSGPIVLAPAACAVLLHEAVAHALEIDTLVLSGRPQAALGVRLGSENLDVLDSPAEMPAALSRDTDDEGLPVLRRWLLQRGRIKQPLADRFHAGSSPHLLPGAARRSSRHLPPVPRSTHLELVAGGHGLEEILAGAGGLYFPEISRGRLDPLTGRLSVRFPYGRRFQHGKLGEWVGESVLRGQVSEVLAAVEAVGDERRFAGAGWCAKAGHRLPVWATCPHIRLAGLEVGA